MIRDPRSTRAGQTMGCNTMNRYDQTRARKVFAELVKAAAKEMENAGLTIDLNGAKDAALLTTLRDALRSLEMAFDCGVIDFGEWMSAQEQIDSLIRTIERRNPNSVEAIRRGRRDLLDFKKPRLP
jgi:hypothetical protein